MKNFMSMSPAVQKAYQMAVKAHKGQLDKAGKDYIYHPLTVASNVGEDETAIIVALLHDTVEDTNLTFEDLEKEFSEDVLNAVKLLTHDKAMPYLEYIQIIHDSGNATAVRVKLADLANNMDLSRFGDQISQIDIDRVKYKYVPAVKLLRGN